MMQTHHNTLSKHVGTACLCCFLVLAATGLPSSAEERTLTAEEMEALAKAGDFTEAELRFLLAEGSDRAGGEKTQCDQGRPLSPIRTHSLSPDRT